MFLCNAQSFIVPLAVSQEVVSPKLCKQVSINIILPKLHHIKARKLEFRNREPRNTQNRKRKSSKSQTTQHANPVNREPRKPRKVG